MSHRKWGGGRRRLGMNLRRKMEEDVRCAEGGGKRLVTRDAEQKTWFWSGGRRICPALYCMQTF